MTRQPPASAAAIGLYAIDPVHYDLLSAALLEEGYEVAWLDPNDPEQRLSIFDFAALLIDVRSLPVSIKSYFASVMTKPACPPLLGTAAPELAELGMRDAFAMGCVDFVQQPFQPYDVTARINLAMRRSLKEDGTRHHIADLEHRLQQQQQNMTEARRLQSELSAPASGREGQLEFAHLLRPSQALGGDLANVMSIDARYSIFYMLDVAGHGIASTLYAVSIASWLQVDIRRNLLDELGRPRDPSLVVADLNNAFPLDESGLRYFTMTYGFADFEEGAIHYTRAGHTELVVWRGEKPEALADGDTPVGVLPSATFTDLKIPFPTDSIVLLFSDGVVDQPNPSGERFGLPRLLEALQDGDMGNINRLVRNLQNQGSVWRGGEPILDDQSILVLKRLRQQEKVLADPDLRVYTQTLLRSRIPATLESASAVAALVGAVLVDLRGPEVASELRLAMMEALSNVIRHGYRGIYGGSEVIEVALIDDRERVGVTLIDYGPAFDPTREAAKSEVTDLSMMDETPHLGLSLVSRSVDEMFYERRGDKNHLRLVKVVATGPNWFQHQK